MSAPVRALRPVDVLDLLADPRRVAEVPVAEVPGLLIRLAALQSALATRVLTTPEPVPEPEPQLLDAEDAARLLAVPVQWLRRRPHLPFVVKLAEGTVRYHRARLLAWIDRAIASGTGKR